MRDQARNNSKAGELISLLDRGQQPANPPLPTRDDSCTNCIYAAFDNDDAGSPGLCHANPPQVFVLMTQDRLTGGAKQAVNACFPPIGRQAWCGMFEPAIVAVPEKNSA
jgi:hypothetical protein